MNQRLRDFVVLFCTSLLATIVYYRFQIFSGFTRINGDLGDSRLVSVLNQHWCHVISGERNWLDLNFYFPIKSTLGYSDAFLASGLLNCAYGVVTGQSFLLTTQYSIMTLHFLSGLIFALYLRSFWNLGLLASAFGGVLTQINSPLMNKIGHLQMQVFVFLPVVIWCLSWLIKNAANISVSRKAYFAVVTVCVISFHLQLMTTFYPAWFFCFFGAVFFGTALVTRLGRSFAHSLLSKRLPELSIGLLLFGVFVIPFVQAYLPVVKQFGGRSLADGLAGLPHPAHFLRMGEDNLIWGSLTSRFSGFFPGLMYYEKQIGIGLILSAIYFVGALWGVLMAMRLLSSSSLPPRIASSPLARSVVVYLFPTCLLVQLLLTYHGGASPWVLIHHYVPGASAIRAAGRYMCVLMLPLSFGFAVLMDSIVKGAKPNPAAPGEKFLHRTALVGATAAVAFFALAEQVGGNYNYDYEADHARMSESLAELQGQISRAGCTAFYVQPVNPVHTGDNVYVYQVDAMVLSEYSGLPTVNGYSGQFPHNWKIWRVDLPEYRSHINEWISNFGMNPASLCGFEY